MEDKEGSWLRQLLLGLGALLAAALVIGGVGSLVALSAAKLAGVGSGDSTASAEPSLYFPTPTPEPSKASEPSGSASAEPAPDTSAAPSQEPDEPKDKPDKARKRIRPSASPTNASTSERIYLRGSYPGGNGTTLQVQRFEGGWSDFPVSATVRGGSFETWVQSGQGGRNRFRVVDRSTGRASQPVSVVLH